MRKKFSVFSVLVLFVVEALGAPAEHLVKSLPGFTGAIPFKQYAGLVTIEPAKQRQLFYWLCESQRDPAKDPLVLWLNGGPGSSSLIGFFAEHGPWRPINGGTTLMAAYNTSWNRVANVLYVEAPAFVGFSRSGDSGDKKSDDAKVASENYDFIQAWFELFPEYRSHDFYLASESYGGHYIPQLAEQILLRDTGRKINMKGFMIGNPAINSDWFEMGVPDAQTDAWPFTTMMYTHGFVPHAAYAAAVQACGWQNILNDCITNYTRPSQSCLDAVQVALDYIPSDIDLYNVDAPACLDSSDFSYTRKWSWAAQQLYARRQRNGKRALDPNTFDPCIFPKMTAYLNEPAVQTALHVPATKWEDEYPLDYSDDSMHLNIIPMFNMLFRNPRSTSWRMLIFSGDLDGCIPFVGTQKWIACLGRPVSEGWRPWRLNGQVAGSVITYDKITFLTVHGSGHAIPWYTPNLGYTFFQRWIEKQSF